MSVEKFPNPEKYVLVNPHIKGSSVNVAEIQQQGNAPYYQVVLSNGVRFTNIPFGNSLAGAYYLREKTEEELSKEANEYLDETLGTFNSKPNEDKPCDNLESSLKEDLQRVHEALKDSLLRVESQAFAIFVKENKGTDIATDYYNFRKLAGRFK